jgi:hypothetical protein
MGTPPPSSFSLKSVKRETKRKSLQIICFFEVFSLHNLFFLRELIYLLVLRETISLIPGTLFLLGFFDVCL